MLRKLLRNIAFHGFPQGEWLPRADVNPTKLKNDARKFAFIEALGQFNVPVVLLYDNHDTTYKGKAKSVNLLSLSSNAQVFSALDEMGRRIPGYPYSALSSGDERAVYSVVECPHPNDPVIACLDINNDGHYEYTFVRTGKMAYQDKDGKLSFAPPVISKEAFDLLLKQIRLDTRCQIHNEIVLTARQYREVAGACGRSLGPDELKSYVRLNSPTWQFL